MDANDRVTRTNGSKSVQFPTHIKKILKEQNSPLRSYMSQCFKCTGASGTNTKSPPHPNVWSSDIISSVLWNIQAREYIPVMSRQSNKIPIVIFFHGGGFVKNSCTSLPYDEFCRRLAFELPCVVISITYPLAPEFKCPNQYDIAEEYLMFYDELWAESHLEKYSDNSNVFLAGDDAGGNIVHHLATLIVSKEVTLVNLKIRGLISIQPLFGGEERTQSEILLSKSPMLTLKQRDKMWRHFLPDNRDRDCKEVNVSGPNNTNVNLRGFPKTLVIVGGWDPLQDWQKRYYEWLRKNGVDVRLKEYSETIPQFYLYPQLPQSAWLIDEVRLFVRTNIYGPKFISYS